SRWRGTRLFTDDDARYDELSSLTAEKDASAAAVADAVKRHPTLSPWIRARGYWQNRGESNLTSLFALMLSESDAKLAAAVRPIEDALPLRFLYGGQWMALDEFRPTGSGKLVAVLDDQHAEGTSDALCRALKARSLDCVTILAGWGKPTSDALTTL